MPFHFEIALGDPRLCALLVAVDGSSGKATAVERIELTGPRIEGGPYDSDDGLPQRSGNQH
jgi:calcineurin-like phosphoesterase